MPSPAAVLDGVLGEATSPGGGGGGEGLVDRGTELAEGSQPLSWLNTWFQAVDLRELGSQRFCPATIRSGQDQISSNLHL